jgi:hypothetical protein
MYIETLCVPAVLFIMIMLVEVVFALYENNYQLALVKFISYFVIVLFLELLCVSGMEIISWIIVFLPLIFYTYTTFLLYFVFGTNPEPALKQYEVK